ncbi:MAG: radical SAM protein [Bacteroidales bacterium]|nr:radical SAM protein [Bacteroidales bacterium]
MKLLFLNKKQNNIIGELSPKIIRQYNKKRSVKNRQIICHAPFKSLTFFFGGKVMACWHNKQYLIGQIPENTIEEIWFGEKLKKLREHIIANNLSLGCFECDKNIQNGFYTSAGAWRYDYLPEAKSEFPVSIDFQTSNQCNNECIMCIGEYSSAIRMHREKKNNYRNPYGKEFIQQLELFIPHLKEASFSGGEVFLSEHYFEIWEKFAQINPDIVVSVTTNGTVVNDRVRSLLNKLKFNINISIDSLDKNVFERIRKNSQLDIVLSNLQYFIHYTQSKNTNLSVRVNVMQQNYPQIPELIKYLNNQNIRIHFNQVIFPPYSALWSSDESILNRIIELYQKERLETNTTIQQGNNQAWNDFINQIKQWKKMSVQHAQILQTHKNTSIDKLVEFLLCRIKDNLKSNSCFALNEKDLFITFVKTTLDQCQSEINNDELFKRAIIFYLTMPINRLIDEFNIRDTESLIEFTKQAGTYKISI